MVDREIEIIQKIIRGDDKAFRLLYESYFHKVLNYAQKFVHCQEDAREIAQDVFIKLWDKRAFLDPKLPISGLMFRITKFLSIDRLRKQSKNIKFTDITLVSDAGERSLENEILGAELHSVYHEILDKLPQKRRLIFHLSRDKNMSYNEIAKKLDISPKTVEAQIRLALQQIRSEITHYLNPLLFVFIFI